MAQLVDRYEDMSKEGRLMMTIEDDGDVILTIIPDSETNPKARMLSVQFCTRAGGGRSPLTLRALHRLYEAMSADNLDASVILRKGEFPGG